MKKPEPLVIAAYFLITVFLGYFLFSSKLLESALFLILAGLLYASENYFRGKKILISKKHAEKLQLLVKSKFTYGVIAGVFITFLITKHWIFGIFTAILLLVLVLAEIAMGIAENGLGNEIRETVIAILFAFCFWYGLSIILSTPTPLNAIVTCSMIPQLSRGDLIILQGGEINAPEISLTKSQVSQITSDAKITYKNDSFTVKGSIMEYCMQNPSGENCEEFFSSPSSFKEMHGPLSFNYEMCERTILSTGQKGYIPCVKSVSYAGKEYGTNLENDIVVYQPKEGELYSYVGDIIHRVHLKIGVNGVDYYLIKGDNNEIFDIQRYNYDYGLGNGLVSEEQVKGKVLFRVPYLGYFKLLLSGLANPTFFVEPAGCDRIFSEYKN